MQEDKKAAVPAGDKPPGICDWLQRAFHARPAFRPLRHLAVRHHEDGAARPADAGAGATPAEPVRKHSGPPVPAPPRPLTSSPSPAGGVPAPTARRPPLQPAPVLLPAVTTSTSDAAKKAVGSSVPTGLPVPAPPPDVTTTSRVPAADEKAGEDKAQQTKGKNRAGFSVFKALSSN